MVSNWKLIKDGTREITEIEINKIRHSEGINHHNPYILEGEIINEINTPEDFVDFARNLAREYKRKQDMESESEGSTTYIPGLYDGQYVNLNVDIDYEIVAGLWDGEDTISIQGFSGIFDGNGHSLKNWEIGENSTGIFCGLSGTVANLMIYTEGNNISSDGIFYDSQITAKAVNTGVLFEETSMFFAGFPEEDILTCTGVDDVEVINQQLAELDIKNDADEYLMWKWDEDLGHPILTDVSMPVIKSAYISDSIWGDIKGFYSKKMEAWTFLLPRSVYGEVEAKLDCGCAGEISIWIKAENERLSGEIVSKEDAEACLDYSFCAYVCEDIPVMGINTYSDYGIEYMDYNQANAFMGSYRLEDTKGNSQTGVIDDIRGRGNNSWRSEEKRGYNITFNKMISLCGLDLTSQYALLPGQRDNSLWTYMLTSEMSRRLEMEAAPKTEFIHLYIDGNYMGVYFLTPKVCVEKNRIDIQDLATLTARSNGKELYESEFVEKKKNDGSERYGYRIKKNPPDITGGYLLELANADYDPTQARFISKKGTYVTLKNIPYASIEEVDYIANLWEDFEEAFASESGFNNKGKHYSDYIDMDTFAMQWLAIEFNNESSNGCSIFFYKDSDFSDDNRLHALYLWDVEHSFTLDSYESMLILDEYPINSSDYWGNYCKQAEVMEKIAKTWFERFRPIVVDLYETDSAEEDLESWIDQYGYDLMLNELKYPENLTFAKIRNLKEKARERIEFLDKEMNEYLR